MTVSSAAALDQSLATIERRDPALNCFTALYSDRARTEAANVDRRADAGVLAGTCFAVKNLFDVAGERTIAGSIVLNDSPPACRDATVVERLRAAGSVLVGATNMDEFAYGFSTENAHYGPTRNPHDPDRIAGGSSGGSAAAVAAGMVPISLGSDTNGSIRIPASLCGVWGLKPTFGRLSRRGAFPFVASLDHVGPFASSLRGLAGAFDAMQGYDSEDPAAQAYPDVSSMAALTQSPKGLRVGRLGGWFSSIMTAEVAAAFHLVARAAGAAREVELPGAEAARSAAFYITAAEGAQLHLERLRARPQDFDPATRDRLLAGALLPAANVIQAHRVRSWFQAQVRALFSEVDLLIAPATIMAAPTIGQESAEIGGRTIHIRANLGLYTQPLSFAGLPVIAAPVATLGLPVGVQIIAAPWQEERAFALAAKLERDGVLRARIAAA